MRALVMLLAACAIPASAQLSPPPGVTMQIYTLPADPPGDVRQAPGGGRVLTPTVLFRPSAGENIRQPAIVMLGRGPGSNPGHAEQATRWAAERLAAKGFTVLSIQSHADRGFPLFPFYETALQIDAALDSLETRGYEDFILIGESYGAAAVAHYLATDPDPSLDKAGARRVHAAIYLDPLTELRHYPGVGLEKNYDAVIARAEKEFATGKNAYTASRTIEIAGGPAGGNRDWLGTGFFVAPAEGVLDYWGPKAAVRNASDYRKNPVPTLAVAHEGEPTVSLSALRSIAKEKPVGGMDIETLPEAADRDVIVARITGWLDAKALGARPPVTEQLIDTTTADGQTLSGVLYSPARPDPTKPALLLTPGRTGEPIQSSTHWMGWRFAQMGYVVLAPSLRISGPKGIYTSTRKEVVEDISAWMNRLDTLGQNRVIAAGHSNGGIWISDYAALKRDPRVVGMIYFAPTVNVETWAERKQNPATMKQMQAACGAVAKGRGYETIYGVQNAVLVCDSLNEGAVSHPERLAKVTVPGLFIMGSEDALFKRPGVRDRLEKAYAGKLESLMYEGGSHGFRENKDRLAGDVDAWIRKTYP